MQSPGVCNQHGLPGLSHTYSSAWSSYQKYNSFIYLVECFRECRRLKWPLPEALLSEMDQHFDKLTSAEHVDDARRALGVGTSPCGGEVQFDRAIDQANHDQLCHYFDAVRGFGVAKLTDQIAAVAKLTGRTEGAIKAAYYRNIAKK
jgi:hypothetical protein